MVTWPEYKHGLPQRLLLPIEDYVCQMSFVAFQPSATQVATLSQQITAGVLQVVRNSPNPALSAIKIAEPVSGDTIFRITYGDPIYDFQVQLNKTSLMISKRRTTIENYVLTLPLFENLSQQLLGSSARYSLAGHDFIQSMYHVSHRYTQQVTLGSRLTNEEETPRNFELMTALANFGPESVYEWIAPERTLRCDVQFSFVKTIAERPANLWVGVKAPWNANQRELEFNFTFRRGDVPGYTGIGQEDFNEWEIAAKAFLKDYVIDRLYRNLFRDVNVSASLR